MTIIECDVCVAPVIRNNHVECSCHKKNVLNHFHLMNKKIMPLNCELQDLLGINYVTQM